MTTPPGLEVTAASRMPTRHGEFRMESFRYRGDPQPHFALHTGLCRGMRAGLRPLVRIHSECVTGEIFGSRRCDCGEQLDEALRRIHAAGCGALIYLRQEGRGIGIENKLRAYTLQDQGLDTVDANLALDLPVDARDYAAAGAWLDHRKIRRCTLLTNNADKLHALQQYRIDAVRAPLRPLADAASLPYLAAKRERLGQDC